jgi:acylphosphatase
MIRAHIFVSGLVQGVYFRANAASEANGLGITGWIKNLADGRVEIIIEGTQNKIDIFVSWCKKGPANANVQNFELDIVPYIGEFNSFNIIH